MASKPVEIAIVGSGCRFPGDATTPSKLWDLLKAPRKVSKRADFLEGYQHTNAKYHGHANVRDAYMLADDAAKRQFDASFFGVNPLEAHAMDPQIRMTLETIYEALEDGGHSLESLRGSDTAVYAGQMVADYELLMHRDHETMATYHITGTARTMLSSRVSFFYDWTGPSMTIDTACSSSLSALHHAVQQLRTGHSRVAVVTAANLIFDVGTFIAMSNFTMLSPDSECRMWDASANGYARGDGVAAIILKTREAAEADGDHIECIIRETALNQDGRSLGPTMPSASAQAQLIRDCYARAGLDLTKPSDRPQFFEAHGTGTQAGDPTEAEAISTAFFPDDNAASHDQLLVGSIKTVIGHTEGTAGLAGLMKASLALQNSSIPANMLFKNLNPKLNRFYNGKLRIPTQMESWPDMIPGVTKRASVNSFGFGGANGHVILEAYTKSKGLPSSSSTSTSCAFSSFVFSAATEDSLSSYLQTFLKYLQDTPDVDLADLAYTLHSRRSRHAITASFSASSAQNLCSEIESKLNEISSNSSSRVGIRAPRPVQSGQPKILGIFTGQGAQWAQMGLDLVESSPAARSILTSLQSTLDSLPAEHRPEWTLLSELRKEASSSRVMEAALSQPLCTALQIIQVDLLRSAGISFSSVVGHSSGEIGAAYAAGFLSAKDAICVAYYRGLAARIVGSNAKQGAMLAVGTSQEDAEHLLSFDELKGRVSVAAVNSPTSVTLSGDLDAIEEIIVILTDEKKFVRKLKVDKAYHSHHMLPCSEAYMDVLSALDIQIGKGNGAKWFSSVSASSIPMAGKPGEDLECQYWNDNMVNPVLFLQALENALHAETGYDLVLELGPHPALKGPANEVIQGIANAALPYTGMLSRGASGKTSFSAGLGYAWSHLEAGAVDLRAFETMASGRGAFSLVKGLPLYSWDHEDDYWYESRQGRDTRLRKDDVHPLLGHLTPDSTAADMRWRHILKITELPWLTNHRLQNAAVFPATGYIASVFEAALKISSGMDVATIDIQDMEIGSAVVFEKDDSNVEILLSVSNIVRSTNSITANFHYHSGTSKSTDPLELKSSGRLHIALGSPLDSSLPKRSPALPNMIPLKAETFYDFISRLEYGYTGQFQTLNRVSRKLGACSGHVAKIEHTPLIIHPGVLDACYQSVFLTNGDPHDGSYDTMHIPRRIKKVSMNPKLCLEHVPKDEGFEFDANRAVQAGFTCDVDVFTEGGDNIIIQTQGLECVPISGRGEKDDVQVFSTTSWHAAVPRHAQLDGETENQHFRVVLDELMQRRSRMKILELQDDASKAVTKEVLSVLGTKFASYTVGLPEGAELADRAALEASAAGKLAVQEFDFDALVGDDEPAKFDLIITTNSVAKAQASNLRRLSQAGAYLLLPTDESVTSSELDSILREASFDGVHSDSSMIVTRAVDDKANFLTSPLKHTLPASLKADSRISELFIVHGDTESQSTLANGISTALAPFCDLIKLVPRITDMLSYNISSDRTTVLNIAETQDTSVFADLSETSWDAIRSLITNTKLLVWATRGRRAENPHANMITGLLRGSARDNPLLKYQLLDFESKDHVTAEAIASALLSYKAALTWRDAGDVHLDCETELVVDSNGEMLVSRVMMSEDMNGRYNANFRKITTKANSKQNVALVPSKEGWNTELVPAVKAREATTTIETSCSLVSSILVSASKHMFLSAGKDKATGQDVLALSSSHGFKVTAQKELAVLINNKADLPSLVSRAGEYLVASAMLEQVSSGDRVLLHEPTAAFAAAMQEEAQLAGVSLVITSSRESVPKDWVYIHPESPSRLLGLLLGSGFATVINMDANPRHHALEQIISMLPDGCIVHNAETITSRHAHKPSRFQISELQSRLAYALDKAQQSIDASVSTVSLEKLVDSPVTDIFDVIDWTAEAASCSVKLNPVEKLIQFPSDKTYWLVGLAGSLGLSLCEWMVNLGAKHFAISSRNPQIESIWMDQMAQRGANIQIVPCDMTKRDSVRSAFDSITTSMPPIAGVAQGAMVLKDTAIQDMSLSTYHAVTKPKVEGSIYLNELFQQDTLDFFICFSSVASIVGNFGQSNYASANTFMASLVEQRRRQGLAASVIHIGPVFGVGYLTRVVEGSVMGDKALQRSGYCPTSERQFHQLFGEGVLASRPEDNIRHEVISGVLTVSSKDTVRPAWESWPRLNHLVLGEKKADNAGSGAAGQTVPLKDQLTAASNAKQVFDVIWKAFTSVLSSDFHIKMGKITDAELGDMRFDQMGIDSLTAVEIRGWFMTNLSVKIPVLKILNGTSVNELVAVAAEEIPSHMIPALAKDEDDEQDPDSDASASTYDDTSDQDQLSTTDESDSESTSSDIVRSIPVSFTQSRFYPSGLFLTDSVGLNHTLWGKVSGAIDPSKLRNAIRLVGENHEILRTAFYDRHDQQMQHIMASSRIDLEEYAIDDVSQVSEMGNALHKKHVYNVVQGETARVILLTHSSTGDKYIVFGVHPLVLDATSLISFFEWVAHYYSSPSSTRAVKQFSQVSQQQRLNYQAGKMSSDMAYWKSEFATQPPPLPVLSVASVSERPQLDAYENVRGCCTVEAPTRAKVAATCKRLRVTPFHFYLTVLRSLLFHYAPTGEDVTIAVAENGRGEDAEDMDVLGCLYNLVLLRLQTTTTTAFSDLLQTVRSKTYAGLAHSKLPVAVMTKELGLQEKAKHSPFFQVFIDYRLGQHRNMPLGDKAELAIMDFEINVPYDVYLDIVDAEGEHYFSMRNDMFDQEAADVIAKHYGELVEMFAEQPDLLVGASI